MEVLVVPGKYMSGEFDDNAEKFDTKKVVDIVTPTWGTIETFKGKSPIVNLGFITIITDLSKIFKEN